jgi:hypothetical protein
MCLLAKGAKGEEEAKKKKAIVCASVCFAWQIRQK